MKITMLSASFTTLILRYYLLMSIVIISFVLHIYWLSFLALPVFLSAILAISFTKNHKEKSIKNRAIKTINSEEKILKAA